MTDPRFDPSALRILLVEDNDELRNLITTGLGQAGHWVTPAEDGEKGLAALHAGSFDLLITDMIMPGSEGIEVILSALAECPKMKVIAMSGGSLQGGHDFLPLAEKVGASAVMQKPFGLGELLETVRRVFE